MANRKLPREVHLVHGTKSKAMNIGVSMPEQIRARVPFAAWANDASLFTRERFVEETANYLHEVYGIGSAQDQHVLMMLADQMAWYISARTALMGAPLVVQNNAGKTDSPNPLIAIADRAMNNAIKLMNELGLTPKSRLTASQVEEVSPYAELLRGYTRT